MRLDPPNTSAESLRKLNRIFDCIKELFSNAFLHGPQCIAVPPSGQSSRRNNNGAAPMMNLQAKSACIDCYTGLVLHDAARRYMRAQQPRGFISLDAKAVPRAGLDFDGIAAS